jgi:hypothetical protein
MIRVGEKWNWYEVVVGKFEGQRQRGRKCVDGRIILKLLLKWDCGIDPSGWGWGLAVLNTPMNPGIQKIQEICWLDGKLLASQEELCSSEIGRNKKMVTAKRREKKAEDREKMKWKKKRKVLISRTSVLGLPCMFDSLSKGFPSPLC